MHTVALTGKPAPGANATFLDVSPGVFSWIPGIALNNQDEVAGYPRSYLPQVRTIVFALASRVMLMLRA